MARRDTGRVIRLRRGARQHPQWRLGDPPRRRKRSWVAGIGLTIGALTLFVALAPAAADAINGFVKKHDGCRVVQVIDGDTVRMLCPRSGVTTGRVLAYDTPELRARCLREFVDAQRAIFHLRRILWTGSEISARIDGQDRYGRALVLLIVDGQGVARQMVETGLARWYDGGRRAGWCGAGFGGFDV